MDCCPKCRNKINPNDLFCGNCGFELRSDSRLLQELEMIRANQDREFNSLAKCPWCGSTSLSGHKKGFGVGKAVVGAWLFGPLGLMAGNFRAKKIKITCLNCGKKFKR